MANGCHEVHASSFSLRAEDGVGAAMWKSDRPRRPCCASSFCRRSGSTTGSIVTARRRIARSNVPSNACIRSGSVLRSPQGACASIYLAMGEHAGHPQFHALAERKILNARVKPACQAVSTSASSTASASSARPASMRPSQFWYEGQRALGEIAEAVRQIGIGASDDRLVAERAVIAEAHVAQQEIAQRVDAVIFG